MMLILSLLFKVFILGNFIYESFANNSQSLEEIYNVLKSIQSEINTKEPSYCYHAHSGTRNAFIANSYQKYTKNLNVLIYPFCLVTHELGNRLGNYFHELACAEASGLHFMTVHHQWDLTGSFHGDSLNKTNDEHKLAFLNALPDIIVHTHPLDRYHAQNKIQHECKCTRYCWQQPQAPWANRTDIIGKYLQKAFHSYITTFSKSEQTKIDRSVDFSNAKPNDYLPLIPNVALQYRCGDNIGFSYMYGIIPFTSFLKYIPTNTKYIYVLSDHPTRAVHSPYTSRCHLILQTLFEYLQKHYPNAIIVVKRGGDLFLDYVRLGTAEVTICSASSYCFWPAVSNPGHAYFPLTSLIGGADSMALAPNFGDKFHWMDEIVISNMKKFRPWTQILDVLVGKIPMPQ